MLPADRDARAAACLLAVDPTALQGAVIHGTADACERWLAALGSVWDGEGAVRRIPSNVSEDRLIGGLDVAATLAAGRPVAERGILATADGGIIALPASRVRATTVSHITRALDAGEVIVERDGLMQRHTAAFAVVVCVEDSGDVRALLPLADRVGFVVDLTTTSREVWSEPLPVDAIRRARRHVNYVRCDEEAVIALCHGAETVGVVSPRVILSALAAARANAALCGRDAVTDEDLMCAARLVLRPRAVVHGDDASSSGESSRPPGDADSATGARGERTRETNGESEGERVEQFTDVIIRAAQSALAPGLLAMAAVTSGRGASPGGRAGEDRDNPTRGRQVGTRRGAPRDGARLNILATLRAAAPMQRVRRATRVGPARLVELRRDDFRISRRVTPATTTTVFVVDTSGSAAIHRLAETKGGIELLLAEGYARRDRVAMIAFRGTSAELVLPATHALARARRVIAGLAAGGGTPLAAGLDLAVSVAHAARLAGEQVTTVVLTDARANVGRDGRGGRARAESDALDAAARLRAVGADVVLVDTSPRPEVFARRLANELGGRYVALPPSSARGLTELVTTVRAPVEA